MAEEMDNERPLEQPSPLKGRYRGAFPESLTCGSSALLEQRGLEPRASLYSSVYTNNALAPSIGIPIRFNVAVYLAYLLPNATILDSRSQNDYNGQHLLPKQLSGSS